MQTTIKIKGTHCSSCKALIEDICQDTKEIEACNVDLKTGETIINHSDHLDWQSLKKEIEESGDYEVILDK
ncbi:MAG: heavy metal-associated domain-containing protein [bacterium]|nr:heavy metal-associated domain-containing protein [bacterium]